MTADTVSWWQRAREEDDDLLVAYFSMEFGIHERLPIYSGGLGVLAGDHLKAAAELGVPLVGVGLLYTGGYFRQGIDKSGRQTEDYQPVDPEAVGLVREDVSVTVDLAGESIEAGVWRKDVASAAGVVPLYLLEVDWLTDALYGGDREHRIRQELLLGVGGVRALAALGIEPTVFHLNEGHSAFLLVERLRALVAAGAETDDALESIRRSSVFTTHTPVPAGNEVFDETLVARYAGELAAEAGLGLERLLELGRFGPEPGFGLTPFALRLSASANGVSDLHGEVAREMWAPLWPDAETPIGHVTNGVHLGTWLDPALAELLRYAGVRPDAPPEEANWDAARDAPPEAIWRVHAAAKARLAERAGIERDRLTIGFARRFATYKRAGLVFSDVERLLELPVQIVVAGKAHPADAQGKDVMQEIVALARDRRAQGRVVFLENYDMRRRARARPRLRRLAEHAAPAARGVGDERDEGSGQRRPQPLRARRLVGRGLLARRRLGDRRRLRRGGRRPALQAARGAGRADVHREPRALDRDDERVDRAALPALLDAPRRDRVRRPLLLGRARFRPSLSG